MLWPATSPSSATSPRRTICSLHPIDAGNREAQIATYVRLRAALKRIGSPDPAWGWTGVDDRGQRNGPRDGYRGGPPDQRAAVVVTPLSDIRIVVTDPIRPALVVSTFSRTVMVYGQGFGPKPGPMTGE
jgi:hypothetical protein